MSDFDKEAEREKLREKYERDQEKREVAEKMSELLLQGATMTNAHCSECGDPIFRYDGQEFCATCERAVDRESEDGDADADGEGDDGADSTDTAQGETIEVTSPSDDARVQFGGEAERAEGEALDEDGPGDEAPPESPAAGDASADRSGAAGHRQPGPDRQAPGRPAPDRAGGAVDAPSQPASEGDVTPAREALVRTLTRFSQAAERSEDPARAREHLAAAREAAEALSALRR